MAFGTGPIATEDQFPCQTLVACLVRHIYGTRPESYQMVCLRRAGPSQRGGCTVFFGWCHGGRCLVVRHASTGEAGPGDAVPMQCSRSVMHLIRRVSVAKRRRTDLHPPSVINEEVTGRWPLTAGG